MSQERISLESKIAHLEATIDALNDEVYLQQKSIKLLERKLELLIERWQEQHRLNENDNADEAPPPHY